MYTNWQKPYQIRSGMTAAGVGYAVRRGEAISIEGNYQLTDQVDQLIKNVPEINEKKMK